MSVPSPRLTGLLISSLVAGSAATASAATTRISDQQAVDVSTDGHYVLFADGSLLDRTTGETRETGFETPLDLAATKPLVLARDGGGPVYLRDLSAGVDTELNTSVDEFGKPVLVERAVLVRDGAAVIFQTAGATPRILEYDVATKTSTLRLSGVSLRDASENGEVITWWKALPAETRPAGTVGPANGDPLSVAGSAVGYQLGTGQPHVVATSTFTQRLGAPNGAVPCATQYGINDQTDPVDLEVAQDGASGQGHYSLLLSSKVKYGAYPGTSTTTSQLTVDGSNPIASGDSTSYAAVTRDPVSSATVRIRTTHASSPLWNFGTVTADDGTNYSIEFPLPAPPSTDTIGFTDQALPFSRGAGVVFTGRPRAAQADPSVEGTGTYVQDGPAVGASTGDSWLSLPRSVDAVVTGNERTTTAWASCTEPPALDPADYAAIQVKRTGNSSGAITARLTPSGNVPARSVTATVTWLGFRLWSSTARTDGTINLPWIPPYFPGFRVNVTIPLLDGRMLTESAALYRTF